MVRENTYLCINVMWQWLGVWTEWTVWASNPGRGKRFVSLLQNVQTGAGALFRRCGQGLNLTTHLHLVPRLRMSGTIPLRPHMLSWRGHGRLYLSTLRGFKMVLYFTALRQRFRIWMVLTMVYYFNCQWHWFTALTLIPSLNGAGLNVTKRFSDR